jgi:hypothetical protein
MDYITRRWVVAAYGGRSVIFGGPGERVPRLMACGPRVIYGSFSQPTSGLGTQGTRLLVPVKEVQAAFEDLGLTEKVGPLPPPVEAQYCGAKLDLLDAFEVERLIKKTGITAASLKRMSDEFFDTLRRGRLERKNSVQS